MRDTQKEMEKRVPCREPDAGLDLWARDHTLSQRQDAQPLSHPDVPIQLLNHLKRLILLYSFYYTFILVYS